MTSQASQFTYPTFTDASSEIRILTIRSDPEDAIIRCTLEVAPLEGNHTCLSYTWGPDIDHKEILVNGQPFRVRPNLYNFLHTARRYCFIEPIWTDAVCINQQDIPEKNKQVQMMGDVYKQAIKTMVWLGLSDQEHEALRVAERFTRDLWSDADMQECDVSMARMATTKSLCGSLIDLKPDRERPEENYWSNV